MKTGRLLLRLIHLCFILATLVLSVINTTFGESLPATNSSIRSTLPKIITGDINGDGKIDLICLWQDHTRGLVVKIKFSNGNGTFRSVETLLGNKLAVLSDIITGDVNGDGKADLIIPQLDLTHGLIVEIKFSNGNGTFRTVKTVLGDKF